MPLRRVYSAKPYTLGSRSCPLCLAEKTEIAKDSSGRMLNRRRELMNRCLHKDQYKLSNYYSYLSAFQVLQLQDDHVQPETLDTEDVQNNLPEQLVHGQVHVNDEVAHELEEPSDPEVEHARVVEPTKTVDPVRRSCRVVRRKYENLCSWSGPCK